MKKIIFSTMIASLLAFVGCQNEELVSENTNNGGEKVILTANIQGATDSRVVLTPDTDNEGKPIVKVEWRDDSDNPEIFKVYNDQSECEVFTQTQGNNFEGTLPNGANRAYYGYDENRSYDLSSQDGTLNENYILMQAPVTDGSSNITFEHRTAILKVEFKGINNQDVTKIVMDNVHTGSNNESITVTPTQASLGYFYIFLPIKNEGGYGVGHTFHFTVTASGKEYTGSLTIPADMSIVAGKLYTAKLSIIIPYVTFSAVSEQTLDLVQTKSEKLDEWGNTVYEDDEETIAVLVPDPYPGYDGDTGYIEYSVGNSNVWTKYTPESEAVEFGGEKGDLRLRGISPNGTLKAQIEFGNATPVACSGDIRTLVNWENYASADTRSAIFYCLFKNCTVLTSAPELPATTLAAYCYKSMFYGCTGLINAPELPATSLAESCYGQMFQGCTNLAAAPELSATDLANDCYNGMFTSCTSLTSAPELPATMLKPGCYNGMFRGCTLLVNAPELPATKLETSCYTGMFFNCESLISAPALPATTLETGCYYEMFKGCTKLNSVTMLATNIPENGGCLTNWLEGVATTGTFTKHEDMTSLPTGASGIPTDWIVNNY